jgi:Leucine-rich repeat (LRR) protein
MAELLFVPMERLIEALCSSAAEKIGLLWGVQDDLQSLTKTVSAIKAVLLDAEKQAAGSEAVKDWLGNLEEVIYDADDLLDAVSTEALRREIMTRDKKAKTVRIFFSESNQLVYRLKMARKIKAIRKRLDAINADRQNFRLEERHVETRVVNRERDQTHSLVRKEVVIGRENDKKAVIDCLMDSKVEEDVSVLPIVGIGGLGKTTLAKLVFNDEEIQKGFDLKMWVCVSDIFDVKNIVAKILESATNKEKPVTVEMDTLVKYLLKKIEGKKYFLVLDDVWNGDHKKWCCLKEVLMGGARGSRILVTTRNEVVARTIRQESVARIIGTVESYSLKGLDEDASWSLFKLKAFEKGQEPKNSSIVALGKEMVGKCSGVPLAITTIGSLLGSKNSEKEWLSFKNNELSKISQEENGIIPTLKLSYDHLPSHLKHCFAYCSLYPKDYEIDASDLVKHWIAQGFVMSSDDENRCLEEVGYEYLKDLLWRSFFQEAQTDDSGDVIECKMHDLMHDLAISVAGSLIATLDDKKTNVDKKNRHVSLLDGYYRHISSLFEASRMRTILCFNRYNCYKIDCDELFSRFKFLRMLDLSRRNLDSVSSSIGELKHLRYLDLSANREMKKLPDSITSLHNLQTLRLFSCDSLEELPRDIKKLVNLRHLDLFANDKIKKLPDSIASLHNLQTLLLSHCYSLEELPRDIKKLVNLRHLEIDFCLGLTYMPRGLGQLNNLRMLTRFVVHSGSHSSHCADLRELNGLNQLRGSLRIRNLGHVKGVASEFKDATLKDLQHLHTLGLHWNSDLERDWDVVEDETSFEGFQLPPNLKGLYLIFYPGLRIPSWVSSLTNLIKFDLYECKCQYLPPLSQLPSLKTLSLNDLDVIEYISDSNDFSSSSSSTLDPFFPSLNFIRLDNCSNLKGWWRRRDSPVEVNFVEITEHPSLPSFPRLSRLEIDGCPMLTSMPMFPHLEEELFLKNTSWKPLQHTMMMNMATPQSPISAVTTSSSSTPLSKLKRLTLYSITDLVTLPLQHLTFLQDLSIQNCPELEFANDEDEMQWQGLKSLFSLDFSGLPKLLSLPSGLQHATSLEKLKIKNCENLTAVPDWIHNCKSLEFFEISRCSNLTSLPEGMGRLTSLQRLKIDRCPILLRRCKRDTGEDWAKIAHVPKLVLL